MTPELFAQIVTAIGGPGAVLVLVIYSYGQNAKAKAKQSDPAQEIATDIKEIKDALAEIEKGVAVLLDRRK